MGFNPELLRLAVQTVSGGQEKAAFQPGPVAQGPPPGDPAMGGGGMPPGMDPMMGGGMPPGDPSMGGGMPPGGGPPMDPAALMGLLGAMGGPPPAEAAPAPQEQPPAQQQQQAPAKKKFDPAMLDLRLWHIEKKLAAIMNALNIALPADSMTLPPQGDLLGEGGLEPIEQPSGGGDGGGGQEQKTAAANPSVSPDLVRMAEVVNRVFGEGNRQ